MIRLTVAVALPILLQFHWPWPPMGQDGVFSMTKLGRCLSLFCLAWTGVFCPAVLAEGSAGPVRLALPDTLYAVPGLEANLYFDNVVLVLEPGNYAFDVDCAKGIQQAERWTFLPQAGDVGAFAFTMTVRDQANAVVGEAASTLRVVAAAPATATTALLVGDSLTHASVYSQRLLDLFNTEEPPTLTLVGTHQPKPEAPANRHEGYGGWRASTFATRWKDGAQTGPAKERGSPFLYEDEQGGRALDFARYCEAANGGAAPDFVTFFLGCNDTFGTDDAGIEAAIDAMFGHMDALLAMVRDYSPTTRIGLLAAVPPAATQDAFGANYRCGQTRWQYKRNQHRVVERMRETYGAREAEGIFLVPAYVNLDCVNNYPVTSGPRNAHCAVEVTRLNNGVHPDAPGYRQIGDSVYCWMQAVLER